MQLNDVKKLLTGSAYKSRSREIAGKFKQHNIDTLAALDNAPRVLGPSIFGFSTYQLIAFLREAAIAAAIAESEVPAPEPDIEIAIEEAEEQAPKPIKKKTSKEGVTTSD